MNIIIITIGGALATLLSFELARISAGIWGDITSTNANANANAIPAIEQIRNRMYYSPPEVTLDINTKKAKIEGKSKSKISSVVSSTVVDDAAIYQNNSRFLTALQDAHICTYTYGAPRVGNAAFLQVR
jgi:hypothetical protein